MGTIVITPPRAPKHIATPLIPSTRRTYNQDFKPNFVGIFLSCHDHRPKSWTISDSPAFAGIFATS